MHYIFRCRLFILIGLLLINVKYTNGQDDTLFDFDPVLSSYDFNLIQGLPVRGINDLNQLNPLVYRSFGDGSHLIDGFYTGIEYQWFDGVNLRFLEDMPLRLIKHTHFNDYEDYFTDRNTITGSLSMIPVHAKDRFSIWIENSSTIIHKTINEQDLQLVLSGPVRFNKSGSEKGVFLNYTLGSRLFSIYDKYPSYILRDQATDEYLAYLDEEPLRRAEMDYGTYANALFTEADDSQRTYFNTNAGKTGFSLFGTIMAELKPGLSFKLGSYTVSKNEQIPVYENFFFNQENNPERTTLYSSNYLMFEHKIDINESVKMNYKVQGQYSYLNVVQQDPGLKDDLFRYGYVGKFETHKSPTFEIGTDTTGGSNDAIWILNSWDYDTLVDFTPGSTNPDLASYTSSYYSIFAGDPVGHYQNYDQIQLGGGLLNGTSPDQVYGLWNNAGTGTDVYAKRDQRELNLLLNGDLEIGKHSLGFGFQFSRDVNSDYQINTSGLWGNMNSMANFHISELDITNSCRHEGPDMDTIFYYRKFDALSQRVFDRRLREVLGLDPDGLDFIDINSYDFDLKTINYYDKKGNRKTLQLEENPFSLNLFSPDELHNHFASNLITSGYDYLGNKIHHKVSFEDFFNKVDDEGIYTRETGSYIPLNYSAYVDYKIKIKGWSIDVGLRLDAFNANQQVLKDPYLWYEAYTVGEMEGNAGFSFSIPSGIANDYVVYVDNVNSPTRITGFRNGDDWYDVEGKPIQNPNDLDVGSGISPYIIDPTQNNITMDVFTANLVRYNLLPQVSVRKSFLKNLLISLQYNSSVKNPENEYVYNNPALYYYYMGLSYFRPNGSLKPERVDKLNAGLAYQPWGRFVLSASGFFDHYTSLLSAKIMVGAYPNPYFTYDNFNEPLNNYGTDIGIQYYSGKTSGFNYGITYHLVFNDDQEKYHQYDFRLPRNLLKGYLQFNTGYEAEYIGPSGSVNYSLFSNIGLGAFAQFQSGVYYMEYYNIIQLGTTGNLPISAYLDLKVEKGFRFRQGKYLLNLYCVIQNLFNSKIIYEVYRTTGEPDDDGYLEAPEYQHQISEAVSEASYRYLYASYINNPNNYGLPRRTTIGISFSF